MIIPKSLEDIATLVEGPDKLVLFFTAGWCGDCRFILPQMPEIEAENDSFVFVEVDRDKYMPLAQKWDVFGIPSFIVLQNGKELGRLVNKNRKTKDEINQFFGSIG
ncbi:thioredoxin family protein [Streptococcus zalophi]|uniref:thioredoxin family protein n=1 Tax=Streptococcus zalophi TaxID=640031 RepID=UPI00215C6F4F|nr:thioredoxin family protein [Streptococcus zalophi]MCR8968225.1 thioredoxin family protein [Streptococcus zalophi]